MYDEEYVSLAQELLEALQGSTAYPDVTEGLFDLQRNFIQDPSLRKILLKGRRAGGTFAVARYLFYSALNNPDTVSLYLALSRVDAKELIWDECKKINYTIGGLVRESDLQILFSNGSKIWLSGADKAKDAERFRGPKYKLVVLDEAASFADHLSYLIQEVLTPALRDQTGTLALVGTPGRILTGFFYEAAEGIYSPLYSKHHWTVLDNPMFEVWAGQEDWQDIARASLQEWAKEDGLTPQDPKYIREWLGQYVIDTTNLLLVVDPAKNLYTDLPHTTLHVLGIDLGNVDCTAFSDLSFSPHSPTVYICREKSLPAMSIDQIAQEVIQRRRERPYQAIVADTGGLGKLIVEEINKRYTLNIQPAEKQAKADHIELFNSDLRRGNIKAQKGEFWDQASRVQWNKEHSREAEGQKCDLIDATLYAYRAAFAYLSRPVPTPLSEEQRMLNARVERLQKEQNKKLSVARRFR